MPSLFGILALGFVLGMRHATDTDHVVAVTTLVSRERSVRAAGALGAAWGAGHTVTILLVGGAILLFRLVIPPRLVQGMEFSVALMLVTLGVVNLSSAGRRIEELAHGAREPSVGGGRRIHPAQIARSLAVGVVHGLAGSAAVALLVLTTIREPGWGVLYLVVFGIGTVAGMSALTSAIAIPFAVAAERFTHINRRMVQLTAFISIGLGLFLAYRIGFVGGLFLPTSAPG